MQIPAQFGHTQQRGGPAQLRLRKSKDVGRCQLRKADVLQIPGTSDSLCHLPRKKDRKHMPLGRDTNRTTVGRSRRWYCRTTPCCLRSTMRTPPAPRRPPTRRWQRAHARASRAARRSKAEAGASTRSAASQRSRSPAPAGSKGQRNVAGGCNADACAASESGSV